LQQVESISESREADEVSLDGSTLILSLKIKDGLQSSLILIDTQLFLNTNDVSCVCKSVSGLAHARIEFSDEKK
jgi:hypothetical protein